MKKLLSVLLLSFVLILSACGSGGGDELEDFTEGFNKNASGSDVAELKPDEFDEEVEDVGGMGWKELYASAEYSISAKYADLKDLSGYHLSIDIEQPFQDLKGVGYEASIITAETLGLDIAKFEQEFEQALSETTSKYRDNGYTISFFNNGTVDFGMYFDENE